MLALRLLVCAIYLSQGPAAFGQPSPCLVGLKNHEHPNKQLSTNRTGPIRELLLLVCLLVLLLFSISIGIGTPVSMNTTGHYNDFLFATFLDRRMRFPSPSPYNVEAVKGHGGGGLYYVPVRALHALVRLEPRHPGGRKV